MLNILTIAKKEITRLRIHFKGGVRPLVLLALMGAGLVAYITFQRNTIQGRGLYRVGVPPGAPHVQDSRFDTLEAPRAEAERLLQEGVIDDYIVDASVGDASAGRGGGQVLHRNDEKSLYAVGALELYLEKQELARIEREYDADRAFPLRVEANYFPIDLTSDAEREIFIPSLMRPPLPLAQVVTMSIYLLPVFFVSIFFTSGFIDEKTDRRINLLLSAPVKPFQIIAGKMLPYVSFTLLCIVAITVILQGNILLALAIFTPVTLFIFAIYLMVPLTYRTYKDTTFISMFVTTTISVYLIFPAVFTDVNDLSYMSPLTLAIKMYQGQSFSLREYLTATAPMYLIFALLIYVGSRILNEEYLMQFRPLYKKAAEAIYLAMHREHLYLSTLLASAFLIPVVYIFQLGVLTISLNLPIRFAIIILLILSVLFEEIVKSASIAVMIENEVVPTAKHVVALAFLSALGFLIGEKALLFISISVVAESALSDAIFSAGLLWIPLVAHFVFTTIVCLPTYRWGVRRYPYALFAATLVHALYNFLVITNALSGGGIG